MISCARKCLSCPVAVFSVIVLASVLALAAAYASEYFGRLSPCILCLYQRIPFIIVIALGLLGLALRNNKCAAFGLLSLSALAFLANAAIAFYHSGVERRWWASFIEGCKIPAGGDTSGNWIDSIMSTPAVPCSQIAWVDPFFGLSMANYNVLLNLILFTVCVIALCSAKCAQNHIHGEDDAAVKSEKADGLL